MREAPQVPEFCHQGHGGHEVDAAQAHQRRDDRLHAPGLDLGAQRLRDPLNPIVRFTDRVTILDEGDVLGGVGKADGGQVAFVRCGPGTLADIPLAVSQQHGFELLTGLEPGSHRILARPRQIPDRFIPLIRHGHAGQLASPAQTRQLQGIASVSLDPLPGLTRDLRGGHHLALIAPATQLAHQMVPTRSGLVDDPQCLGRPQMPQRLEQRGQLRRHRPHKPRPLPSRLGRSNRDRVDVHVQSH